MNSAQEQIQSQLQIVTQEDIRLIKQDVSKLSNTLSEVHQAIIGNSMTRDGGIVQRVIDLENEASSLSNRIIAISAKMTKAELYVKIIWAMGGSIAGALLIWLVSRLH